MPDVAIAIASAVATQVITRALFDDGGGAQALSEAAQNRVQDRADEMYQIYLAFYSECEKLTIQEICSEPVYIPQFDAVRQRSNAEVLRTFAVARKKALYCLPPSCSGQRIATIKEMSRAQARSIAFAMHSAKMNEDTRAHLKISQRINNRLVINNIGMNINSRTDSLLESAARLHALAAQRAQGAFGAAAKAVGQLVNRGVQAAKLSFAEDAFSQAKSDFRRSEILEQNLTDTATVAADGDFGFFTPPGEFVGPPIDFPIDTGSIAEPGVDFGFGGSV
jgi:hypothetical protein